MELEVVKHDGPARLGILKAGGLSIPTPSSLHLVGELGGEGRLFEVGSGTGLRVEVGPSLHVMRPNDGGTQDLAPAHGLQGGPLEEPECILVAPQEEIPDVRDCRIVAVGRAERGGARRLVDRIVGLRRKIHPNAVLVVPDAEIWSYPLLCLAGVDIIGDSQARAAALSGEMLFESSSVRPEMLGEDGCRCPACMDPGRGADDGILGHNEWITERALFEVRMRIRLGEIKHLAEERCLAHPELYSALKMLYKHHGDYLEEHTSITPGVGI